MFGSKRSEGLLVGFELPCLCFLWFVDEFHFTKENFPELLW